MPETRYSFYELDASLRAVQQLRELELSDGGSTTTIRDRDEKVSQIVAGLSRGDSGVHDINL